MVKARKMDAIANAGGNAFFDYQVPSAWHSMLKKGFYSAGALAFRTRGLLMLLDPRIQRQRCATTASFWTRCRPIALTHSIEDVEFFFGSKNRPPTLDGVIAA